MLMRGPDREPARSTPPPGPAGHSRAAAVLVMSA
jgi:hypothetical protein